MTLKLSSSEEDKEVSASEEEAVTETDSELESASEIQESSCSDDISADEGKRRKSEGKSKSAPSNSSTVTKPSKKAPKKSNKRNKSLSEEEMEDLYGKLEERREDLNVKIKEMTESSGNLKFYPSRAALRKELMADRSVLPELTAKFIDEFIEVIRQTFYTNMHQETKRLH